MPKLSAHRAAQIIQMLSQEIADGEEARRSTARLRAIREWFCEAACVPVEVEAVGGEKG